MTQMKEGICEKCGKDYSEIKGFCNKCGYSPDGKQQMVDVNSDPFWKCGNCGRTFQAPTAPEKCPSCGEACGFKNATCYTPDCGGPGNINPQI